MSTRLQCFVIAVTSADAGGLSTSGRWGVAITSRDGKSIECFDTKLRKAPPLRAVARPARDDEVEWFSVDRTGTIASVCTATSLTAWERELDGAWERIWHADRSPRGVMLVASQCHAVADSRQLWFGEALRDTRGVTYRVSVRDLGSGEVLSAIVTEKLGEYLTPVPGTDAALACRELPGPKYAVTRFDVLEKRLGIRETGLRATSGLISDVSAFVDCGRYAILEDRIHLGEIELLDLTANSVIRSVYPLVDVGEASEAYRNGFGLAILRGAAVVVPVGDARLACVPMMSDGDAVELILQADLDLEECSVVGAGAPDRFFLMTQSGELAAIQCAEDVLPA